MSDFALRVTPEELKRKSDEFSALIRSMRSHFDRVEEVSGKTRGYWRGEAGDKSRIGYASYKDDINFIINRMEEHPRDLLTMAGIYEKADDDVEAKTNRLKIDQIV